MASSLFEDGDIVQIQAIRRVWEPDEEADERRYLI
jgi:hypothetical protein